MARKETISISAGSMTELTMSNVQSVTFQNHGPGVIELIASDGTVPSGTTTGPRYFPRQGEANVALSDLFPGVAGAVRLFARTYKSESAEVFVSHA